MPTLDNAAHEAFVRAYIANKGNGAEAYSSAYPNCQKPAVASAAATRLLKIVKVTERIAEFQAQAAKRTQITLEGLIEEAAELQRKAAEDGAHSAAVSALTLKAKLAGFHIDRNQNVNISGNYAISDRPLTEEEWKKDYVTEH